MQRHDMKRFAYSRNGTGPADEQCPLRITIPSISTVDHHVRYHVHVSNTRTRHTWRVSHRYSEFRELHDSLLTYFAAADHPCPGCTLFLKAIQAFEFPPKHMFTSSSPVVLNYRKRALRAFLALLASHTFTNAPKCPTCKDLPFSAVRDFLVTDQLESAPGSPQSVDSDTIRQSLDVKEFTKCVAVGNAKAVNSEGLFIKPGEKEDSEEEKENEPEKKASKAKAKAHAAKEEKAPASPVESDACSTDSTDSSPKPVEESKEVAPTTEVAAEPQAEAEVPKQAEAHVEEQVEATPVAPKLPPQHSSRDSIDNEFGSLNMDFMSETGSAPKESTL